MHYVYDLHDQSKLKFLLMFVQVDGYVQLQKVNT